MSILKSSAKKEIQLGERVQIPAGVVEFNEGGNTIWVQSVHGTIMRIKCTGKIVTNQCKNSPCSHVDMIIQGDVEFCLSQDVL